MSKMSMRRRSLRNVVRGVFGLSRSYEGGRAFVLLCLMDTFLC